MFDLENKKVGIWGAGSFGRKAYSYLKNKVDVVCFYDSNEKKSGTILDGIPIRKWSPEDTDTYILIASTFWEEIVPGLVKEGLKIFKDFVLYDFICNSLPDEYSFIYDIQQCTGEWTEEEWIAYKDGRQLAILNGGCKEGSLSVLLSMHPVFRQKYKVIEVPRNYLIGHPLYSQREVDVAVNYMNDVNFLRQVDLFFYESENVTSPWNMQPNTVREKLSPDCKQIIVSPLRFSGYFPQCRSHEKWFAQIHLLYAFRYTDKYIDALWKKGYSEDEIVSIVKKEDFLSAEEVEDFLRVSLVTMALQEEEADVKISDYIEEHCREEQLFYDPAHPTNKILIEYADRIIQYLFPENNLMMGDVYSDEAISYASPPILHMNEPIYPCVVKTLGLSSYEKCFYVNKPSEVNRMLSFDEYIREYIRINLKDKAL